MLRSPNCKDCRSRITAIFKSLKRNNILFIYVLRCRHYARAWQVEENSLSKTNFSEHPKGSLRLMPTTHEPSRAFSFFGSSQTKPCSSLKLSRLGFRSARARKVSKSEPGRFLLRNTCIMRGVYSFRISPVLSVVVRHIATVVPTFTNSK